MYNIKDICGDKFITWKSWIVEKNTFSRIAWWITFKIKTKHWWPFSIKKSKCSVLANIRNGRKSPSQNCTLYLASIMVSQNQSLCMSFYMSSVMKCMFFKLKEYLVMANSLTLMRNYQFCVMCDEGPGLHKKNIKVHRVEVHFWQNEDIMMKQYKFVIVGLLWQIHCGCWNIRIQVVLVESIDLCLYRGHP